MISRIAPFPSLAAAAALGLSAVLPAQVQEWIAYKAKVYRQEVANTAPVNVDFWSAGVAVVTTNPQDAALVTLTGGGIPGAMVLENDGNEWWLDGEYESQAEMNAMLPANATYTLTVSGGTLGVVTQTFTIPPEVYPNTPFLTGSSFATTEQFPVNAATGLTWNGASPLGTAGWVGLAIEDRAGNDLFETLLPSNATAAVVPANSLQVDDCHSGWVEFVDANSAPAGGFGVPGLLAHAVVTDFEIRTWPYPTPPCAWHRAYGSGCVNLELTSDDPMLGGSWNLTTYGIDPVTPLGYTFFSLGPQQPGLPLVAVGLNAPGCEALIDINSIAVSFGGVVPGGVLGVTINIPPQPSFAGMMLYAQTVALTPLLPVGFGTSNGVEAMIGS